MANLDELILKVAMFPFNNYRSVGPAEASSQYLVCWAVVMLQSPHKPRWVIDRVTVADDCIIGNSMWHQLTSSL